MAKLKAYYGLCPIIDHKSFLGIEEDSETENVIVTLGKNIAIKYKLSDQKPLISWRTKDKFTSPVVYNSVDKQYCAVFNHSYLRIWSSEDETIDKLKKFKFNKQIHTLMTCNSKIFIVFRNGYTALLTEVFEDRKEFVPLNVIKPEEDMIIDVLSVSLGETVYIGLLIKSNETHSLLWTTFNGNTKENFKRINLTKANTNLFSCILMQNNTNGVNLVTLWSDGKLWCQTLDDDTKKDACFAMVSSLSNKSKITMVPLSQDYIAMYGADSNQEGASIIIFNVTVKVTQSHQYFKLFTSGTKLWRLHSNVFLCVGQNLAVVPYHLDTEQLAALIGTHKAVTYDPDIAIVQDLIVASWGDKPTKNTSNLEKPFGKYTSQGWSQSRICEEVLPKYFETNDVRSIGKILDEFCDIPELFIVKSLEFALSVDSKVFKNVKSNLKNIGNLPQQLTPPERCQLIDKILRFKCSDVNIIPYLRTQLSFSNTLTLLRYICYLLSEDGHSIAKNTTENEEKLFEWGTVLVDANYQKFLISKDEKIVEILTYFNGLVKAYMCSLDELQKVAPILNELKRSKTLNINRNKSNRFYSVEKLSLY